MLKGFKQWASDKWDYLNTPQETPAENSKKMKKHYSRIASWGRMELDKRVEMGGTADRASIKATAKRLTKTYFEDDYTDEKYKAVLKMLDMSIKEIGLVESKQEENKVIPSFRDYLSEQMITEKLVTFGGKAYPKFGQVVILAGGAGSGKGFALSNLIGIEGNVLDVDAVKKLAMGSEKLAKRIKDETGQDIKNFDLSVPKNVSKIHELLSDIYGITKASQQRVFSAALAAAPERKPNIIFDVTLKDMSKLERITSNVKELGYDEKNIHIVWVVNDVNIAIDQNKSRDRVVPEEILLSTHEGASLTMRKLVDMDNKITSYMDGDIWFIFNKAGTDTDLVKSDNRGPEVIKGKGTKGGSYIKDANFIQIKRRGGRPIKYNEIGKELIQKIADYTPTTKTW